MSIEPSQESQTSSIVEQVGGTILNKIIQIQDAIHERVFRNRRCILRSLHSYDVYGKDGLMCAWYTGIGLDWDKVTGYFAELQTPDKTYYIGFHGPLKQLAWFYSALNSGKEIASYARKKPYYLYSNSESHSFLDLALLDQYRSAMDHFPHPLVSLPIILDRIGHPRDTIGTKAHLLSRVNREPLKIGHSIRDLYLDTPL
jgi:hypothetical protein